MYCEELLGSGFEGLEERVLLAGSVNLAFDAGTGILTVTGDNLANQVSVLDDGGIVFVGDGTTAITNSTGNLVAVTLADGRTGYLLDAGTVEVNAFAKGGNDTINIQGVVIAGVDLNIDLGAGNDLFNLSNANISNLLVLGGSGKDSMYVGDVASDGALVALHGGDGNDNVRAEFILFTGELEIYGGNGNDVVSVNAEGFSVNALTIHTGNGNDSVTVGNTVVNTTTEIDMGNGKDDLALFRNTFAGEVDVFLGAGQDKASLDGNNFAGLFALSGGAGKDRVFSSATNFFAFPPVFAGVEVLV